MTNGYQFSLRNIFPGRCKIFNHFCSSCHGCNSNIEKRRRVMYKRIRQIKTELRKHNFFYFHVFRISLGHFRGRSRVVKQVLNPSIPSGMRETVLAGRLDIDLLCRQYGIYHKTTFIPYVYVSYVIQK